MKKKIVTVILILFSVVGIPFTIVLYGFSTPPQFDETYYGELGAMYNRLTQTEGKKIVIIGMSSVPFGVDSELMQLELIQCGMEYSVCNFGLYGALGIKVMLDLSIDSIGDGDIVIFAPEIHEQAMTMYFSATDMWYAADSNFSMLRAIAKDDRSSVVGNFVGYVSEKVNYLTKGEKAQPSGVYAKSSFNEFCNMTNAKREYNVMDGGYDANYKITFDTEIYESEFIDYINKYYREISSRGAKMYYSFAPMNRSSVTDCSEQTIRTYSEFIDTSFEFSMISNVEDYIMDREWFYDSNFHLNSSGMTVRTVQLIEDLKNELGITVPTQVALPEKPQIPEETPTEGDNSFADYFRYEEDGETLKIISLTEEGKKLSRVIVPSSYSGKTVKKFDESVFRNNTTIREIVLQRNIKFIADGSFSGCISLEKLKLYHTEPSDIIVGAGLLDGAESCMIYVPDSSKSAYRNNYFWGKYSDRYVEYEI